MQLADMFKAEVVDVGADHMVFELTAWPKRYVTANTTASTASTARARCQHVHIGTPVLYLS